MSFDSRWHVERRKQILKKYPEIQQYFGNYPLSVIPIISLVTTQWSIVWLVSDLPWWMVGLVAFFVGQFIVHSLSTFIHEAAHNLILKGRVGSVVSLLLIELGALTFGQSLEYVSQHNPSHHRHLNDYLQDYEWADKNQAHLLQSHVFWRVVRAIFHLLPGGPIITDLIIIPRIVSSDDRRQIKGAKQSVTTTLLLLATTLSVHALAWSLFGWKASLYLFWCLSLIMGNWGVTFSGQSIAEHHIEQQGKTYSTYHWTNLIFFNTGYHDEHHTFPNVAWVHLPKLKQIAPEYFTNDSDHSYFYWWYLWARSIFAPSQYHRYSPDKAI
jgi:sphingolipid 4-desaturase/C4-monooxygenase